MSHIPSGQTETPADDLFGEVIDSYTDREAVEDGFLADLGQFPRVSFLGLPVNRMTGHLFDDLKPFLDSDADDDAEKFGLALGAVLRTKCRFAQGDPGNTGEIGDIYRIPPNLWLVRNEVGGWTAMYPEDYQLRNKKRAGTFGPLSFLLLGI
jgi:hypothetical protein